MAKKKKVIKKKRSIKKKKQTNSPGSVLIVDRRGLSRLLDVSVRHLTDLEADGVIVPLRRGRGGRPSTYGLEAAIPAYIGHVTAIPGSGAEREARRRRDLAQARLTELRIDREQGDLVPRNDVILAGRAQVKAWTAKIRSLPRRLVQSGVVPRESEKQISEFLRALLTDISNWKTMDDLKRAAEDEDHQ